MPFGVDEAGKGPVFGSMVAAAIWAPDETVLPDGVADSKRLSPARREELAGTLRADERIAIGLAEITPTQIDDPTTDMNTLTVEAHARALEDALEGIPADKRTGLCDACDTDADRFGRRVRAMCSLEVDVRARHGADDESPLVGAASILAKVERDAHIEALAAEYAADGEIGSGYPSDPKTQQFLEEYVTAHGTVPPFARRSWATCKNVLAAAEQTSLEGF